MFSVLVSMLAYLRKVLVFASNRLPKNLPNLRILKEFNNWMFLKLSLELAAEEGLTLLYVDGMIERHNDFH